MGNWNISIRGVGAHHNWQDAEGNPGGNPKDADRMARRFVRELKEAGHSITGAEITHGGVTVYESNPLGINPGLEDNAPDPKTS